MKKLFIIFIVLFPTGCASITQQYGVSEESKVVSFSEEIPLDKNQAFPLIMECLAEKYNSAKTIIQYQDKDAGVIVLKAMQSVGRNDLGIEILINYTLTIKTQNGAVRFKFLAGDAEAMVGYQRVEREITVGEMEAAREKFNNIKNVIMKAVDPAYIEKTASGSVCKEGNITVWTADPSVVRK